MENQIKLIQHPIIQHKLKDAGKKVTERISELEIDKQVATLETVKSLKNLRTELNKELSDFESQRKLIKEKVNSPYLEFEDTYKFEISEKYKEAIDLLKDKISLVENKVKLEKKESVEAYFNELCVAEKIDFIAFDKVGIEIKLSTTEKKYKEQVYEYISKVIDDLNLIKATDFEAEILTEYKTTLNVSNAITTVKTRKEEEAKEKSRLKAELVQNRKTYLINLGMQFVEITNAYEFNADVYITAHEIENLSKEDFTAKYSECEVKIKDIKLKDLAAKQEAEKAQKQTVSAPEVSNPVTETKTVAQPISATISAPQVEKKAEPLKTASFEVKATMTQLRALGAYMKSNNITYKNI